MKLTHHDSAYYLAYRAALLAAKQVVEAGGVPEAGAVPAYLLHSWQQSREHGLRSADRRLLDRSYTAHAPDEHDRHLGGVVGDEIEAIWDSFGGENWVAYCTNAQGVVIRARVGANAASRSFALQVGRRILECDIGTTAPSLVLREKRPITLVGAEHYLQDFDGMFCCAVPIWGPWGKVVGVLNVTGSETFKSPLVEKKLLSAAVKIENHLFLAAHRGNSVFRIHYDADFIDTHLAGLVALNDFGDVLSVTRNALEMFDDIDPFRLRCHVGDLFHGEFVVAGGYCLKSHLRNGIVLYTKSCDGDASAVLRNGAAVRSNSSLRELSDLHVLETLRQTGGNISRAASLLGLSRSTLYRVLHKQGKGPDATPD